MKINFHNKTNFATKKYENLILKVLKFESIKKSMEIVFLDDENIRETNKNFRNIDKTTDVLSFPYGDDGYFLGDILINLNLAFIQAANYGHSKEREVVFLAVHGYLHLLGYDHINKEDEIKMFYIQNKILRNSKIERKLK